MTADVATELWPAAVVSLGVEAESWLEDLTGRLRKACLSWGWRLSEAERPTPTFDFELWQPYAAADVMWSWLHGSLPVGCSRTMRHMISSVFDHALG